MKEYTRRITGVIDSRYGMLTINSKSIEDLFFETLGGERQFACTISIVITDLTEDTKLDSMPFNDAVMAAGLEEPPEEEGSGE